VTYENVSVDEFAAPARGWLAEYMPPADPSAGYFLFTGPSSPTDDHDLARIQRCRELQRLLFDGGFAGICVPREYGARDARAHRRGASLSLVGDALVRSVTRKMQSQALPQHAAAMLRLSSGVSNVRQGTIALELAGAAGVVWPPGREQRAQAGVGYLVRQAACIGGGTTEMARNVISKRLLGMPREARAGDGPFRGVPRGRARSAAQTLNARG
jgi:alkylation response protein AidB-like acyl-CoA dehydrogenase